MAKTNFLVEKNKTKNTYNSIGIKLYINGANYKNYIKKKKIRFKGGARPKKSENHCFKGTLSDMSHLINMPRHWMQHIFHTNSICVQPLLNAISSLFDLHPHSHSSL